ncbi:MAG: hypothetical protein IIY06_02960 [Proteobacteria bacterium]|jgi:hypothetical protein|nr:hypothetical protein [Pseudomonadota bacterium]
MNLLPENQTMLESIKYTALLPEQFAGPALKAVEAGAPLPLKMMAAKGILPVPPAQLILVWYQLSLDSDKSVVETVVETVKGFDENTLLELAKSELPEQVLDWLVKTANIDKLTEAVILNKATSDATIMDLAATVSREFTDLIANNHVRLLRSPEIIEKLYLNPSTRMATIDRIINLAKENNVELSGIKALQDAIKAAAIEDDVPGMSDEEFEAILAQSAEESAKEDEEIKKEEQNPNRKPAENTDNAETDENGRRLSRQQLIDRMNAPQRVRLALMGTREDRNILLRDSRRIVYMAVITSPKMSIGEVSSIASNKGMADDIIGYVAKRRDWVRNYPIVVALANNPKCPLGEALSFLKQLRVNDLKQLARSKSISATLARQAQALFRQKQS